MGVFSMTRGPFYRRAPTSLFSMLQVVVLLLSLAACVTAYEMEAAMDVERSDIFRKLARSGQIHVDRRSPPIQGLRLIGRASMTNDDSDIPTATSQMNRVSPSSTSEEVAFTTASSKPSSTVLLSKNNTRTSTSTSSTQYVPTALPTPFDTSLGNNFTSQSCPTFFNSFINNATFKSCLPVSLLLQNSMGFFKAVRSGPFLTTVLDASCSASLAICSPMMANLASQLISETHCAQDYRRQNPVVMQAYTGLMAYEPLYNATCLQNKVSGDYCFVEAVVNNTNAADLYPYYTAIGIPLPASAQPSCSPCLQQTMSMFAGYARLKDQPLSKTYVPCALQVDASCGPTFANADVKVAVESRKSAAPSRHSRTTSILAIGTTAALLSLFVLV